MNKYKCINPAVQILPKKFNKNGILMNKDHVSMSQQRYIYVSKHSNSKHVWDLYMLKKWGKVFSFVFIFSTTVNIFTVNRITK